MLEQVLDKRHGGGLKLFQLGVKLNPNEYTIQHEYSELFETFRRSRG